MNTFAEIWRPIPGFERYSVSSFGHVRSERYKGSEKRRELKLKLHASGYLEVGLYDKPQSRGGRQRFLLVHRLVMRAHVGPCPDDLEVRHLDGDPMNNRLDNLEYGTARENYLDTIRHGNRGQCKLSDKEVREIRHKYRPGTGGNSAELAKEYGVHVQTLRNAATGRTYNWIK